MQKLITSFHLTAKAIGHFISPSLCSCCQNSVDRPGLCATCWRDIKLISDHACVQCGIAFAYKTTLDQCGNCIAHPPPYDDTIAAAIYGGPMREMIISFKHGDRQDIGPVLARIMLPRATSLLKTADMVLPLPLHPRRFLKRRFNQSAELARYMLSYSDIGLDKLNTHILLRKKNTAPQGHKSQSQRIAAMRGAFHVPPSYKDQIKDKHILIIDDVMTTGASMASAAQALKRGGAKRVSALVAARVC